MAEERIGGIKDEGRGHTLTGRERGGDRDGDWNGERKTPTAYIRGKIKARTRLCVTSHVTGQVSPRFAGS
jgi:hypothetical protein